ncbi:methyltransferase domain-containing protein [Sarocladium implicatum]|nr:methyltransferase domain-containing protein [Sarocladium implicatum]
MEPQTAPADVKDRLKASYDAMAPQYNQWTEKHHALRHKYLDKLLQLCPQLLRSASGGDGGDDASPSVIELGCGSGVPVLSTLLSRNPSLKATAVDLSETQIGLARQNLDAFGSRVNFTAGDMVSSTADTPSGSHTAVIALYSLIHLAQSEQKTMIERIANWLPKGGCFLASFAKDEIEGVVMEKWLDEKGWMYWSGMGVEGTLRVAEESGLEVVVKEVEEGEDETFLWVIAKK